MIYVTDTISLSESEIEEHFIRAPGPGGQNVNKVATAVQLRFDAAASPALSDEVVARLRIVAGSRMTRKGVVILTARRTRSQARNRQDALQRLVELIRKAAAKPKKRRPTKPSLASKRKGAERKKRHGELKKRRGSPSTIDD
jgi:ribosome-associated protein